MLADSVDGVADDGAPGERDVFHEPTGRLGVLVVGQTGFGDPIVWAKSEAAFAELKKQFEVPDDAKRISLP